MDRSSLLDILVFVTLFAGFIMVHEATHVGVAEDYGCKNIETSYFNLDSNNFAQVTADCSELSREARLSYVESQQTVEAVGYQVLPGYILLMFLVYAVKNR